MSSAWWPHLKCRGWRIIWKCSIRSLKASWLMRGRGGLPSQCLVYTFSWYDSSKSEVHSQWFSTSSWKHWSQGFSSISWKASWWREQKAECVIKKTINSINWKVAIISAEIAYILSNSKKLKLKQRTIHQLSIFNSDAIRRERQKIFKLKSKLCIWSV